MYWLTMMFREISIQLYYQDLLDLLTDNSFRSKVAIFEGKCQNRTSSLETLVAMRNMLQDNEQEVPEIIRDLSCG